jgi:hypothetical protein
VAWTGSLRPGESHTVYAYIRGEGGLNFAFDAGGRSYHGGNYVSPELAENEYFSVSPDLKIQHSFDWRYRLDWLLCPLFAGQNECVVEEGNRPAFK